MPTSGGDMVADFGTEFLDLYQPHWSNCDGHGRIPRDRMGEEDRHLPRQRDELFRLAGNEPDDSTAYEGMVDFHWQFAHLTDAEHLAAALSPLKSWPEVVLLRLSNYDNLDASVTYKDDRSSRH